MKTRDKGKGEKKSAQAGEFRDGRFRTVKGRTFMSGTEQRRSRGSLGLPIIESLVGEEALRSMEGPDPEGREAVRRIVEDGLPVEAVAQLQAKLKRFGVSSPSTYVDSIVSRASRKRRDRLTAEEGEKLVRVAAILARTLDVWENEDAAAEFLTSPHGELGGDTPIERALSEIGARQVEDVLLKLDLGLPV